MRQLSEHRKALGFLYVLVHVLVLGGAGSLGYITGRLIHGAVSESASLSEQDWNNPVVLGMAVLTLLLGGLALAGIFMGVRLVRGRPVSRGLATLLAILSLPTFPLGTVLGIYSLWFFAQEGWDVLPDSPT